MGKRTEDEDEQFFTKLDYPRKREWIEALRSGRYAQAREALTTNTNANGKAYCCIGVFAGIRGILDTPDNGCEIDTDSAADRLYLNRKTAKRLVELNDTEKRDFPYIADWIEKYL